MFFMISQTNLLSAIARAEWCAMRGKRKIKKHSSIITKKWLWMQWKVERKKVNRFIDFSVFSQHQRFSSLSEFRSPLHKRRLFCVIAKPKN